MNAGAKPVEAVPASRLLRLMTGRLGHKLDRWAVQYTGFSFISWQASRARGIPYQKSLLLTTTGRKTGAKRSVVLPYVAEAQRLVVIASNAGGSRTPAWVGNLIANSSCIVTLDRETRSMRGFVACGAERQRLMDVVAEYRPQVYNYDVHARRKGRRLEVVVLQAWEEEESA